MNTKRLAILAVLILAALLLAAGQVTGARAVDVDAYAPVVGGISVSPSSSTCVGGTVTLSGSGLVPNMTVNVFMTTQSGAFSALLGQTTAGASGNWSLTATIPSSLHSPILGTDQAVTPGTYALVAESTDLSASDTGTINILASCPAASLPASLPSTGTPPWTPLAPLLAILAASGGLVARRARRRRS